ncbi:COMM domain-containing protein 4 [Hyposmocoma kahamanoa]|uniref:COMM domain-containing protein 4 n=1 Tax=Hyposmocoma kahamanoa TaxID=1477025 RepID=UPI000E6D8B45|nr:COMM domain-containing protein 4 [Hyposmocoma kahamanoa]
MKFKFCSDGDCPLWALAALHVLGSLPAQIFRNLLQHVVEEQPDDGIMDILKDTSLSSREECARAAAVIRWVLQQTWRCACGGAQLTRDLLVLGVPRAHATALADIADAMRQSHVAQVQTSGFMLNKVTDVAVSPSPEGTVDTFKLALTIDDVFTGEQRRNELLIEKLQAKMLLEELKKIHRNMESVEP